MMAAAAPDVLGPVPRLPVVEPAVVTAAAAVAVSMAELSGLAGQVLDGLSRSWPPGQVLGLTQAFNAEGWLAMAGLAGTSPGYFGWAFGYFLFRVLLVLLLGLLALRIGVSAVPLGLHLAGGLALAQAVLAQLVVLTGAAPLAVVGSALAPLLLLALAVAAVQLFRRPSVREWARVHRGALYIQRYPLFALLPLLLFGVVPGSDLLDQLPDVQRRWADPGAGGGRALLLATLVVGGVAAAVFVLGRLRSKAYWRRAQVFPESFRFGAGRPPALHVWLLGPAVLGLLVVLGLAVGVPGTNPVRWLIFSAVPLVVWAGSLTVRLLRSRGRLSWWPARPTPPPVPPEVAVAAVRVGDGLAAAALAISGLGLVRSFVGPVALAAGTAAPGSGVAVLLLAAGLVAALGAWPVVSALAGRVTLEQPPDQPGPVDRLRLKLTPGRNAGAGLAWPVVRRWRVLSLSALLVAGLLVLLGVGVTPFGTVRAIGLVATFTLALAAGVLTVAAAVIAVQDTGSPELLWPLRTPTAPIASLVAGALLLSTVTVGDEYAAHGVRPLAAESTPAAGTEPAQATFGTAFERWRTATADCAVTREVSYAGRTRTVRLRPMPMVAAEGGGIRAAYWTAAGLDLLSGRASLSTGAGGTGLRPTEPSGTGCRGLTALFSSGSSGGAVGLTVHRFAAWGAATPEVTAMAGPEPLGGATVGLLVRDPLLAGAGVSLPARLTRPHDPWADRAVLMETAWERVAPAFAGGFPDPAAAAPAPGPAPATGGLVLNSTSATTGCRVWLSELALPSQTADGGRPNADLDGTAGSASTPARADCTDTSRPGPKSLDLLRSYAAATPAAGDHCVAALPRSTAALLASRFPYVTPSAVVGPCGGWTQQQLVDGGYTEDTGLGTVVDLRGLWLPAVLAQNRAALRSLAAATPPATPPEVIVPVVVFLENGSGGDLAAPTRPLVSELLIPVAAYLRAWTAQNSPEALLKRSSDLVAASSVLDVPAVPAGPCRDGEPPDDGCLAGAGAALAGVLQQWRPRGVVVVHQATVPSVSAPLGWALSAQSEATMNLALARQGGCLAGGAGDDAISARGYGSLADALALVGLRACS